MKFSKIKLWNKSSMYFKFDVNEHEAVFYPREYFTAIKYKGVSWITSWGYNTMLELQNSNIPEKQVHSVKEYIKNSIMLMPEQKAKELHVNELLPSIVNVVNKHPESIGADNILTSLLLDGDKVITRDVFEMYVDSVFTLIDKDNADSNKFDSVKEDLKNIVGLDIQVSKTEIAEAYWVLFKELASKNIIEGLISPVGIKRNRTFKDEEAEKIANGELTDEEAMKGLHKYEH